MEMFTYVDYLKYDNILNKNNKYILMRMKRNILSIKKKQNI